jgi:anti-sigma regulatory factor (Ser/Thr protein kinase)
MELTSALVQISEPTHVAEARRRTAEIAAQLAFDETTAGQAAIAVTEAATNLLKHAGGGHLFVGVSRGSVSGLQIVAMDRGGGIRNVPASLRDGTSSAGTAGNGLGAIRRLATSFDLYSLIGQCTVVSAAVYPPKTSAPGVAGL